MGFVVVFLFVFCVLGVFSVWGGWGDSFGVGFFCCGLQCAWMLCVGALPLWFVCFWDFGLVCQGFCWDFGLLGVCLCRVLCGFVRVSFFCCSVFRLLSYILKTFIN